MMKVIEQLYESTTHIRTERVVALRKQARKVDDEAKAEQADRLLERLMKRKCAQVEKATEAGVDNLDILADYIVHHELYDRTPYKIANTEYPFMNERMFEERAAKDTKECAIDKQSERLLAGSRRQRTQYENAFMDRTVRARNKERRRKYREFTKVQPVITYNIRDMTQ